jgi:hypothetical protein
MALSYGFFNAKLDSSSGEYDRTYDAEQFAEYFSLIVSNGVFPTPATQLQVVATSPTSMKVNVSAGYGWINGYYCKNDGDYPLTITAANGSLNRIDAIVLRWVNSSRSMELAVLTGTAAASPKAPTLTQTTETYELMLATVTVAKGVTSISQSAITDKRSDSSVCGWVTGAVESIDTTNLFAQYDTAFQEWFSNIQSQLAGDVATNLQNQIDQCVKLSDKATEEEALAGTADDKWISPKTIPWNCLNKSELLKATSSQTFIVPSGVKYIDLYVVGGGGGGGYGTWCCGGAGGYCKLFENIPVSSGQTITITIGAGGSGSSSSGTRGGTGGTTTVIVNGVTYSASGGEGGINGSSSNIYLGADGGSAGGPCVSGSGTFYGAERGKSTSAGVGGGFDGYLPLNPYNLMLYGCGGGGGDTNTWGYSIGGGDAGGDGRDSSTVDGGEGSGGGATKGGSYAGKGGVGGGGGAGNRYASASGGAGICFVYGV